VDNFFNKWRNWLENEGCIGNVGNSQEKEMAPISGRTIKPNKNVAIYDKFEMERNGGLAHPIALFLRTGS
jgi:hypothetical protein